MPLDNRDVRSMGRAVTMAFLRGLQGKTPETYNEFATTINMNTKTVEGPIAGTVGPLREWKGARQYKEVMRTVTSLTAKKYEKTITIPREDLEDDNIGVHLPAMEMLGVQARMWPDQQVFAALEANGAAHDGVAFFSASHPEGSGVASNYTAGANPAWYLFDNSQPMKAMVWGLRKAPEFTQRQNPEDPHVFERDEYIWGVRARGAAGYGFWQTAYKSKATLDAANFEAAVAAMRTRRDDEGETLNIMPLLLVVPSVLRFDAQRLFGRSTIDGTENIHQGAIRWIDSPRLTGA